MSQWREAAHRGEVALTVLTPARAAAERWMLPEGFALLAFVEPDDGGEVVPTAFRDIARVASWVSEMKPHALNVIGTAGEDVAELRRALADIGLQGAEHLH